MAGPSSPRFVGRVDELALLRAELAVAAAGEPRAVVVGGEAGVGKSRLVAEVAADARGQGALVVRGAAIECADAPLPYAAVSEALRDLARLVPDLTTDGAWPQTATAAPSAPSDETARSRLFESVLWTFERVAATRPVVLVVEDLHWADRSSHDLVAFLVRNLAAGVLLVATHRSNALPRGHRLRHLLAELSRNPRVRALELGPLRRPEVVEQLTAINGACPSSDVVDVVWARSEGNPFFAEELLAAALDAGHGRNRMPPTLHELLLGAVHALSPAAQHVVRVAAAGGRRIGHHLLAAAAGVDDHELVAALREAVTQHILVADADAGTYEFRHALLHEVAYGELLPGERARIHTSYAQAIVGTGAVAVSAELARHWSAAEHRPAALAAFVDAARDAEAACGFAEAHRHLERAIDLWDHVDEGERPTGVGWADLVERAAEDAHLAGENLRAAALLQVLLGALDAASGGDRARNREEDVHAGRLHERLGCYFAAAGRSEDALASYTKAVELVPAEPTHERARVLASDAHALLNAARYDESATRAQEAVELARRAGARLEEGRALGTLGFDRAVSGDPEAGLDLLQDATAIADEVSDLHGLATAYRQRAIVLSGPLGCLDDALALTKQGLHHLHELRLERSYGVSLQAVAADTLFRLGQWDEAEDVLAAALQHDPSGSAAIDLYLARGKLSVGRGRFEAAADDLRTATELSERAVDPQFSVPRHTLTAGLALWEGRFDDARAAVAYALRELADTDELWLLGPVLWHGLRAEAERAVAARALGARRAATIVADATRVTTALLDRARGLRGGARLRALLDAYTAMCEGEASRLGGIEEPAWWRSAGAAWDDLGQPYPAAYCMWREAEALLAQGVRSGKPDGLVRRAHATAVLLGARPLQDLIEALAQRARVDLTSAGAPAGGPDASDNGADLGLTRRELQVLALLATGRTNREIADALFISDKTASVHVSNILMKLGVRSRVEAAGVAQRLGVSAAG